MNESDFRAVLQEEAFCFCAPKTIVLFDDFFELLFQFAAGEGLDIGNRVVLLGVNDLFAAGQLGQLHNGFADIVQTHDMGGNLGKVNDLVFNTDNGILHILGIAAAGANEMGGIVVHIIEIDGGGEFGIRRTGEEV